MCRADDGKVERANQAFQVAKRLRTVIADELWVEGNPHTPHLLSLREFYQARQAVQISREPQDERSLGVGMLVESAKQIILLLLKGLGLIAGAEIYAALKILLHEEQRLISACRGAEGGNRIGAVFFSNRFEAFVNLIERSLSS